MERFVLGLLVGAIVAFALCAPWLAPWPIRLRLLLAGQAPDPFLGLSPLLPLDLSEVQVVDVAVHGDCIAATVATRVRGSARLRALVVASQAPGLIAQLEGWSAVRVPLLLIIEEDGRAELCGPEATLTGFRAVSARLN